jgi:hypothetical protein
MRLDWRWESLATGATLRCDMRRREGCESDRTVISKRGELFDVGFDGTRWHASIRSVKPTALSVTGGLSRYLRPVGGLSLSQAVELLDVLGAWTRPSELIAIMPTSGDIGRALREGGKVFGATGYRLTWRKIEGTYALAEVEELGSPTLMLNTAAGDQLVPNALLIEPPSVTVPGVAAPCGIFRRWTWTGHARVQGAVLPTSMRQESRDENMQAQIAYLPSQGGNPFEFAVPAEFGPEGQLRDEVRNFSRSTAVPAGSETRRIAELVERGAAVKRRIASAEAGTGLAAWWPLGLGGIAVAGILGWLLTRSRRTA